VDELRWENFEQFEDVCSFRSNVLDEERGTIGSGVILAPRELS
jgi:hypothetical protein